MAAEREYQGVLTDQEYEMVMQARKRYSTDARPQASRPTQAKHEGTVSARLDHLGVELDRLQSALGALNEKLSNILAPVPADPPTVPMVAGPAHCVIASRIDAVIAVIGDLINNANSLTARVEL